MKELQNLMDEISEWSNATFGEGQRNPAIAYHLKKEVDELIDIFENHPSDEYQRLWFEYADCMMLLLDSASHVGFSAEGLLSAVKEKLEINKNRKWGKPDKNGVVEHIE